MYVGSSVNLGIRFKSYFNLNYLVKRNMLINRALIKYGYSNFSLEILEYVEKNGTDNKYLLKREQFYIDLIKPQYNLVPVAGTTLGYRWTEEAKLKLREIRSTKKHHWSGRDHTTESKLLMTLSNPKSIPVYCYIKDEDSLKFFKQFNSLREASRFFETNTSNIQRAFKLKKFYKKLYFFF